MMRFNDYILFVCIITFVEDVRWFFSFFFEKSLSDDVIFYVINILVQAFKVARIMVETSKG